MRNCAVEATGRNSVSQSTTPRRIDSKYSYIRVKPYSAEEPLAVLVSYFLVRNGSQPLSSPFTGSDTHRFFHLGYKDFAIADFSCLGRAQNGFHRSLRAIVRNHDLEFRFRKEIHRVLGTAIKFTVPFLTTKSFYLTQSHSFHACRHQRFFHRLGLKWFDDGLDFFHSAKLKPPAFQMASRRIC